MSQHFALRPQQAEEILAETARGRTIVGLTWRDDRRRWMIAKARLVEADRGRDGLLIECKHAADDDGDEIPQLGQDLAVSFRRGSRKCVFNTTVLGRDIHGDGERHHLVLRVAWPNDLHELQRRLFYRTPVPRGRFIPVDLWINTQQDEAQPFPQRGRMLDLSAGGLSVELPREARPRWRNDEQLSCRFVNDAQRGPIEVSARLTHYNRLPDGHVRLGLQFLGLDAGEEGRRTLNRIENMTGKLRRSRKHDRRHGD